MILKRPWLKGSAMRTGFPLALGAHAENPYLGCVDLVLIKFRTARVTAFYLVMSRHHFLSSISVMRVPGGGSRKRT
jgi:hypothetical protein